MKITRKKIIIFSVGIILLGSIGYVAALNGWFGAGSSAVPADTMTNGLVGYWNMDEGGGQIAKDLSGNGNNGTLAGNWYYKMPLTVSNSGSTLTDYQATITINTSALVSSGKMQSDCDDVRFYDNNNATPLNYWIESGCNTATTKFWIKIPSIPNGNKTIYMYYGNAAASTTMSGANTFLFFDDFNDNDISDYTQSPASSFSVASGLVTSQSGSDAKMYKSFTYPAIPFLIEAYVKPVAGADPAVWLYANSETQNMVGGFGGYSAEYTILNGSNASTGSSASIVSAYRTLGMLFKSDNIQIYDSYKATPLVFSYGSAPVGTPTRIGLYSNNNTGAIWDNLRVRKYAATEPTVAAGSEIVVASSWTRGKIGSALKFDGKDDYVTQSYDTDFNFGTGSFSVSGWFKHNTISAADYLVTRYSTAAGTPGGWKVYMDASGDIAFAIDDDGTWDTADIAGTSAIDYDDNKWHYFIAVKNTTSNIKLYIDGAEAASDSSLTETGTLSGTTPALYIGSDSPTVGSYWEGVLDEVRIYNRALSAEEVRYHYNRGGPVAEWNFDEGSGTTAKDGTENNNDLALVNTPSWMSGKDNSALDFESGSSQYGYKTDTASLSITKDLTISAWIKPESITAATLFDIAGKWDGVNESYLLSQYGDEIRLYINAAANYKTTDSANLEAGKWYHVEAVYNAAAQTVNIYINGILQAGTVAGAIPASMDDDTGRFQIGAEDSTTAAANFYDGIIDNVRIYNYARAADEIRMGYNAGLAIKLGPTGKTCVEDPASCINNGLVGYWNMDEGGGGTAKDSSGNNKNGTLTNGPLWTKGKKGNAVKLDGVNDYVSIGNVYNGVKSVSFWLKAGNTTQKILDLNATEYIEVSSGTITATGAGWGTPTIYVDAKVSSAVDTAWRYITIVTATGINASAVNLAKVSSNYFTGILDEVRIYNRALSAEEINYLYNEKKPVGQWDLDEGAGTTAHDSQGNLNITFPADSSERPAWTKP